MSTERELIILELLHDSGSDTFYSAQNLADQLGVSVRTVKSDINNIKKLLSTNEHISIDSVASKGYKLSYQDELTYKELKEAVKNVNDNQELNNQKTRVNTIIYTFSIYSFFPLFICRMIECFFFCHFSNILRNICFKIPNNIYYQYHLFLRQIFDYSIYISYLLLQH